MAKKSTTKVAAPLAESVAAPAPFAHLTVVTVKDLVAYYNVDGKKLRAIIRSLGYRAPATGLEGMAPQAKYEWAPDSPKLAKINDAIVAFLKADDEDAEA